MSQTSLLPNEYYEQLELRQIESGLTPQEWRFVQEYVVDMDEARAYASCFAIIGNPSLAAKKLLVRPMIQTAIARELAIQGGHLFIKKEALIRLTWIEATDRHSKPNERLKAIKLIAELAGFTQREDDSARPPVLNIQINDPGNVILQHKLDGKTVEQRIANLDSPMPVIMDQVRRDDGSDQA